LRIGKVTKNPFDPDGDSDMTAWFHAACFITSAQTRMRAGTKKVESEGDLDGFDSLDSDEQDTLRDLLSGKGGGKKAKGSTKKAPKKKKAKKGSDDDDDDDEDGSDYEEKPKKKKAAKKAAPKKGSSKGSSGGGDGELHYLEADSTSGGKFWEGQRKGSELHIRYGKVGADGASQTKGFDSAEKAQKALDKLIREKSNKGYSSV